MSGRDGSGAYPIRNNQYILSSSVEATNKLIFEVGAWNSVLHDEIWVFDQGFWSKSAELYQSILKSNWEDIILDDDTKKAVRDDTLSFFDSRETYERLKVPW